MMSIRPVRGLLTLLALAASGSGAFAQGLPPPAPMPAELGEPVDGYGMAEPFQRWNMWIEGRKGEAIEMVMATPPSIAGYRTIGRPFLKVTSGNDFGPFRMGEVWVFCPIVADWVTDVSSCHQLYRVGTIPKAAGQIVESGKTTSWMIENFQPDQIAASLRSAGLTPESSMWLVDGATMFAGSPSPTPVLVENVEIATVDSRECPGLRDAVTALDSGRVDWRTDVMAVGQSAMPSAPRPHAVRETYDLVVVIPTGQLEISGSDETLWGLVGPVLLAASACERAAS